MNPPREDGARSERTSSTTPPSSRVRLEVAFLDADREAPAPTPPTMADVRASLAVLIVAAEADFRSYVRECLRDVKELQILEAATTAAAVALAGVYAPRVLIVDEPEREVVARLPAIRAVLIVDDVPHGAASGASPRFLARPFTAEGLLAEVRALIR